MNVDTPLRTGDLSAPARHGLGAYLACFRGIVWREVLRFLYQRERFFSALVRPLVWLFIFAAGFRQVLGVSIIPPYTTYVLYETFITPGLIGMILLFNAMQSSLSMVYDRETGAMRTLLVVPFPRSFLLSSKLVGGVAVAILQAYTFLAIAYFWDIVPPWYGYITVLPALVLSGLMLGALALLMSSLIRQLENFAGVMNFVIFPMFFASSALYPLWRIREGSPLLYEIARFNPFTHAVELIRFALYGEVGAKIDPTMTPVQPGISLDGVLVPLASGELLDLTHLVVVVACTIAFLGAAVFAYNPSKGLIARRGDQVEATRANRFVTFFALETTAPTWEAAPCARCGHNKIITPKEAFVMMCRTMKAAVLAAASGLVLATAGGAAVDPKNPDWPCVQKKVENLSITAIWDGPPVDEHKDWFRSEKLPALVTRLASRRLPIDKATAEIDAFAASVPEADRDAQLSKLFYGLFDKMNTQRRGIISGIEKYQRSQKARAEELEKQGVDIAKLKGDIVIDDTAAVPESDEEQKLYWAGRIFQERQSNIPIACELPQVVEERLFELTRHIRSKMSK